MHVLQHVYIGLQPFCPRIIFYTLHAQLNAEELTGLLKIFFGKVGGIGITDDLFHEVLGIGLHASSHDQPLDLSDEVVVHSLPGKPYSGPLSGALFVIDIPTGVSRIMKEYRYVNDLLLLVGERRFR